MTGRIAGTPRPSERRYAGSFAPGTAARAGRTSSASVSSSESTVSVRGSLGLPRHLRLPERVLHLQRAWRSPCSRRSPTPDSRGASSRQSGEHGEEEAAHGPVLLATVDVVALFGPTGVGKTAVALALARLLRERGEDPIAVSADALQVYRGLEALTGAATADERAELEHRLLSFVDPRETFSAGEFAKRAHAEIDAALAAGAAADRRRRHRPLPPGRPDRPRAAPAARSGDPRERIRARLDESGPERAARASWRARAPAAAAGDRPARPHARGSGPRAARDGRAARPGRRRVPPLDRRAPPSHAARSA